MDGSISVSLVTVNMEQRGFSTEGKSGDCVRKFRWDTALPKFVLLWLRRIPTNLIDQQETELNVSVHQEIGVKVIVIFTERVDQSFGDFQPPDIEYKLKGGKEGEEVVIGSPCVMDPLSSQKASDEVRVDGQTYNLNMTIGIRKLLSSSAGLT